MEYKVVYETHNNRDFAQSVFCDSKEEAENMAQKLRALNHVTKADVVCESKRLPLEEVKCSKCGSTEGKFYSFYNAMTYKTNYSWICECGELYGHAETKEVAFEKWRQHNINLKQNKPAQPNKI